MKNKIPLLFILSLVAINLLSGSCKKGNNSNIPHLLTYGSWQLATLQVTNYVGDAQISIDTLNDNCMLTQFFTFHTDNTCTYNNFSCFDQTTSGNWTLTENNLYFTSDMAAKDTTKSGVLNNNYQPFTNTQIVTLGTYSMVLQTGDVQPNYSSTSKRKIFRYGFIRQKAVN
ncbi:MAG: hypothetical protein JWR38_4466 [Mucilaginibacter sp.]|nr:hypothetical protein [Mucilaginibacter sp.]